MSPLTAAPDDVDPWSLRLCSSVMGVRGPLSPVIGFAPRVNVTEHRCMDAPMDLRIRSQILRERQLSLSDSVAIDPSIDVCDTGPYVEPIDGRAEGTR